MRSAYWNGSLSAAAAARTVGEGERFGIDRIARMPSGRGLTGVPLKLGDSWTTPCISKWRAGH